MCTSTTAPVAPGSHMPGVRDGLSRRKSAKPGNGVEEPVMRMPAQIVVGSKLESDGPADRAQSTAHDAA
jgi:hypothetical protein